MRTDRRSGKKTSSIDGDCRSAFQSDRDRILYSEYFRRLTHVTQVASSVDGGVFHNRALHSLKVSQVARRTAEYLRSRNDQLTDDHVSPDVTEAAGLAHDLGHPPFGHVAEHKLAELAKDSGLTDSFEGNAQSFRILSRLAVHKTHEVKHGLDVTRAVLRATLKYPWLHDNQKANKGSFHKYGAYADDLEAFKFALEGLEQAGQSFEAQIMDFADDTTYSVHDFEDFYRAGLIPIARIIEDEEYRTGFLERLRKRKPELADHYGTTRNFQDIKSLFSWIQDGGSDPLHGARRMAAELIAFRATAITSFVEKISVQWNDDQPILIVPKEVENQQEFLKALIWDFVILRPSLAYQQAGEERIVAALFEYFFDAIRADRPERLPPEFAALLPHQENSARLAIDIVASLSEPQAQVIYKKVTGSDLGSMLD